MESTSHATKGALILQPSGGNVGIGTTNPGDLLHVNGNIRAAQICYLDGTNCKDISAGWGGGGGSGEGLGAYETRSAGVTYTAATDGIVIASGMESGGGHCDVIGYVNSTEVARVTFRENYPGWTRDGITFPVPKGATYSASVNCNSPIVYFVPLTTGAGGNPWTVSGSNVTFNAGNVGIGTTNPSIKLEVAGGVKIANESGTCNASRAGTIRWTGTVFQGCDGSNWVTLSGGGGGGITSCPSGWTMIGDPGKTTTFCIETNERTATNWDNAFTTCSNINDSTHGYAHLCTYSEWRNACMKGTGLSNMTNNWEWVADLGNGSNYGMVAGSAGCTNWYNYGTSGNYNYRCCLR